MHSSPDAAMALNALWTFPAVLLAAFLLAWAAEAGQTMISQGLALAALAWLQTMPEFAIEGVIAWHGDVNLMTANFTGAIRLLVGLGWPMVFFVRAMNTPGGWRSIRKETITLEEENSVEVLATLPPLVYFIWIITRGHFGVWDAAVLLSMYAGYLFLVSRIPARAEDELDDLPGVSRWIVRRPGVWKPVAALSVFAVGGLLLAVSAEPFVGSMQGLAMALGIPAFVTVQWIAPLLSEFPEKVSAFQWASRVKKAPMALMNMMSSNINEWTVLASVIPIVYSISRGQLMEVPFDAHHKLELWLTWAQSVLAVCLLIDLKFRWHAAAGLFVLWAIQFIWADTHLVMIGIYLAWATVEIALAIAGRRRWTAFHAFSREWGRHSRRA